ncbi:MAG: UDP-N-acetylglucosamine--N-acetylmuramyl-(pentapeptide) pyrophosphoryl-undecaprenol N-acetylglucosamine transferase [Clostridiales bacterium]|nr:UDP-N-acetylglucosamine--N-acetylmuramyl-(pentapeptide) pyrophosphoryl-undecaprenol N-acetylglucosamine transferase [Clostridiales bacterium]
MKKILFTGGGSAGHVIPNIALIEELLSDGDVEICYMGTGGIEKSLIADWGIPFYEITCPKLIRGKSWNAWKRNLHIPVELHRAKAQAKVLLQDIQPHAVFSKGGYVALPVIAAARKLHIPCFAHESDFSPGLANRLTARSCQRVFTSFPETAKRLSHGTYSGAPLRRSIFNATRAEARKKFSIPFQAKVLLIFGGGSGSAPINEALRKHLKTLTEKYLILHVCGKGNLVENNLKNYRQFEFIADMGMAYACADLVISRAGAGTVFELLALKKPAILVPLEGQTRGDQTENAAYFQAKGLCKVLKQDFLFTLPQTIEEAFSDEEMRQRLLDSDFHSGNARILQELRQTLQ